MMRTILSATVLIILLSCTDNSAPSTPTDVDHTEVRDSLNMNRDTLLRVPASAAPDSIRRDTVK
jgi:hypothetical protein